MGACEVKTCILKIFPLLIIRKAQKQPTLIARHISAHPDVALCRWQDTKIQLPTLASFSTMVTRSRKKDLKRFSLSILLKFQACTYTDTHAKVQVLSLLWARTKTNLSMNNLPFSFLSKLFCSSFSSIKWPTHFKIFTLWKTELQEYSFMT